MNSISNLITSLEFFKKYGVYWYIDTYQTICIPLRDTGIIISWEDSQYLFDRGWKFHSLDNEWFFVPKEG